MELYIDGNRVPVFGNNGVDILDTIQNTKDIKKIFTAFSQQFSIPASREVNRIFRHYYDFNIQDGFDARFKIDGAIKIDGVDFRKGKIRLNGTTLKDGSPYSYQIVFFGDTVELSDLLGEDELSGLFLSYLDHPYDLTTVRNGFENGLTNNGVSSSISRKIIYPFITHSKQMQITGGDVHEFGDNTSFLSHVDLKPAIQCNELIKAIESKYSLDFSNDFFSTDVFQHLYLWLHREKGFVTSGNENQSFVIELNEWNLNDVSDIRPIESSVTGVGLDQETRFYKFNVTVNPLTTALSGLYDIKMTDALTGDVVGEWVNQSGTQTFTSIPLTSTALRDWQIRTEITTEGQLQTFELDATIDYFYQYWEFDFGEAWLEEVEVNRDYESPNPTETMVGEIIVTQQMPKMKIIDFLTGVFQMFNLTAYKISDGTIKVQSLDEFYDAGNFYDISKHVDYSEKIRVERVLPFRAVEFKFQEPKTFLAIKRKELTNLEFGSLEYTGGDAFDGGKYTIQLPFEKMLFERIQNEDTSTISDVAYGMFLDSKLDPTIGSPLLFLNYPSKSTGATSIEWSDGLTSSGYNAPSNALADQSQTINFNSEIDEIQLTTNENSLFQNFYNRYISNLYNIKARKTTLQAYLPKWLMLQYGLNDVFIVNNRQYRINSVKLNPVTGKSKLELINRLDEINTESGSSQSVPPPSDVSEGAVTSTTIQINWTDISSSRVVNYNVYLNGSLSKTIALGAETHTFTTLTPSTEYEIWVNSVNEDGDESRITQGVNAITVTTTS